MIRSLLACDWSLARCNACDWPSRRQVRITLRGEVVHSQSAYRVVANGVSLIHSTARPVPTEGVPAEFILFDPPTARGTAGMALRYGSRI